MKRSGAERTRSHGGRGDLKTLALFGAGFALPVTLWIGLKDVTTSGFALALSRRHIGPVVGLAFGVYFLVGLVILGVSAWLRRGQLPRALLERRITWGMSAITLWAAFTLAFLPVKGSEAFVTAGRLTTLQLNALGFCLVAVGGALISWLIVALLAPALRCFRSRLSPAGIRCAGAAAAAAVVLVALLSSGAPRTSAAGPRSTADPAFPDTPRVAVIGVDGCDWEKLDPLLEAGLLPTFAKLIESGSYGPLLSIEPLVSPKIWTSIATGKSDDKHGIKGFVNERGIPVNATMRTASTVWDIASDYGVVVGVVGWYVTWPAERVNGFLITDRVHSLLRGPVQIMHSLTGAPTNERLEAFGRFQFDRGYKRYPKSEKRYTQNRIVDEPLRWGYLRDQIYGGMAVALCRAYRPDLFLVYFRGVDFVEHFFWQYSDPEPFGDVSQADIEAYGDVIANYYIHQDRLLSELLDSLGEDANVIIVSDHGFRPRLNPDPLRPELTGAHDVSGVFIASGPSVKALGRHEGATILDVAPTVLALLGLPVPEDMDGRALAEIIRDEHFERHPLASIPSYEPDAPREKIEFSSTMDEGIKSRLRSLGYIE